MQIKSDIETKGEFVNGLIQKVLAAAYLDIEDVLTFVDWLDNELSSLVISLSKISNFSRQVYLLMFADKNLVF